MSLADRTLEVLASWSCGPGDPEPVRIHKAQFTLAMCLVTPAGVIWAGLYWSLGAGTAALIPLGYSVATGLNLVLLHRTGRFRRFQVSELALMLLAPFALQLMLGGYVGGSAVVVWAFHTALVAALFTSAREARAWFLAFVVAIVAAGILQPVLAAETVLPEWAIAMFFVLNLGGVSVIVFAVILSFVSARTRLRSLEIAYLEQNVLLRQQERLATLGTLAAGIAHELNNPAAAVHGAARQLPGSLEDLREAVVSLAASTPERGGVLDLATSPRAAEPPSSPIERSEREQELEDWLDARGVAEPWELAASLVAAGIEPDELARITAAFSPGEVPDVCVLVAQVASLRSMAASVDDGAARISEIVGALRSYTYLDRGEVHDVDVTAGIDSTLVLLGPKLRSMHVTRSYEPGLPRIRARGGELNQVWTNLIDNAVDATGGTGTLTIRARRDGPEHVLVDVEDDGAGMPPEVAAQVFDAFYTTKAPGQGTGLGLNISHGIVVGHHEGSIDVTSRPGATCFRVRLPISAHSPADARGDVAAPVPGQA